MFHFNFATRCDWYIYYVVKLCSQSLSFPYNRLRAANLSYIRKAVCGETSRIVLEPERRNVCSCVASAPIVWKIERNSSPSTHTHSGCMRGQYVAWPSDFRFVNFHRVGQHICGYLFKISYFFLSFVSICLHGANTIAFLVRSAWLNKLIIIWIASYFHCTTDFAMRSIHRTVCKKAAALFATQMATHTAHTNNL